MASQLYESVTANDAKRDALKKKKSASKGRQSKHSPKPSMHPRGEARDILPTERRAAEAKAAAGKSETKVATPSVPHGTASAAEARGKVAEQQRRATVRPPTLAVKKAAEQPKETKVAVRKNDTPPSALGPQRPSGGSESLMGQIGAFVSDRNSKFIPNIKKDVGSALDFVKGNIKANQQRYDNAVKDRIRGGREAGATGNKGPAAAGTPAPSPGATTKPADTKTAKPATTTKPKTPRTYTPPKNPVAAPPSKPATASLGAPKQIHPAAPKRDVAALRARSKQSLADSQAAAAAHRNGPGGGASTVLESYRGNKSHFTKREK